MFGKLMLAAVLTASSASLWAENGMKTFKLSQDMFAVKAGTVITFEVEFESDPGYILAGWSAGVIRKNAPKEFFAKPEVKINPHRHPDYSNIALVTYQVIHIDDVASGLLVYVAQAFLLAASIFGLDYYVKLITRKINEKHKTQ